MFVVIMSGVVNVNSNKSNYSFDFPSDGSANQSDVCSSVLPLRISSLVFSLIGVIYLVYIISALCYYGFKNNLMVGCGGKTLLLILSVLVFQTILINCYKLIFLHLVFM